MLYKKYCKVNKLKVFIRMHFQNEPRKMCEKSFLRGYKNIWKNKVNLSLFWNSDLKLLLSRTIPIHAQLTWFVTLFFELTVAFKIQSRMTGMMKSLIHSIYWGLSLTQLSMGAEAVTLA